MIEIHLDILGGDIHDETLDAHTVGSHHRQTDTLADMLVVKLAVDFKHTALELDYLLGVVMAESLISLGDNVVSTADLESLESLL